MSGDVVEIRPRATDTYVCPCGSQWFTRAHRFDTKGRHLESRDYMQCEGCHRRHRIQSRSGS